MDLPQGFVLDEAEAAPAQAAAPPEGFVMDDGAENSPPSGFVLDSDPGATSTVPSTAPSPSPSAQTVPDAEGGFGTAFQRGVQREQIGASTLMYMMGASDDATFAQSVAKNKLEQDALPQSERQKALSGELAGLSEDDWWGSAKAYITNPIASLQEATESIPSAAASLTGGVAGAVAGSAVPLAGTATGAIAGASLGSAASEYGSSLIDYLEKEGVNVRDPNAVMLATRDPNLLNEAHWWAAKRAGAIGLFELVGGKLGGSVASKFWNPGSSALRKAGGAGLGTGLDALTEGGGEASAQLLTEGKLDAREIVAESLLSVPTSVADVAMGPVAEAAAEAWKNRGAAPQPVVASSLGGMAPEVGTITTSTDPVVAGEESDEGTIAPTEEAKSIAAVSEKPFYSAVEKLVREKGPNIASAEQWYSTLANSPGIKREELEVLGLPDYLKGRDGKIKKDDLLTHIADKSITVEERVQPASPAYAPYQAGGPRQQARELLLKLPQKDKVERQPSDSPPGWGDTEGGNVGYQEFGDHGNDFRGGHYPDPNVLAHVRFNTRTDIDGRKTLFIEEIQSDWHQGGRQRGYLTPTDKAKTEALKQRLTDANRALDAASAAFSASASDFTKPLDEALAEAMYNAQVERDRAFNELNFEDPAGWSSGKVPDAPFKKSWPELAFKRMMRYAADNGFERIAWANGGMQNTRYDGLSPQAQAGMVEFYDKMLPNIAKNWAKKFSTQFGKTSIDTSNTSAADNFDDFDAMRIPAYEQVGFMDLSPQAVTNIRVGLPMFSADGDVAANVAPGQVDNRDPQNVIPSIKRAFAIVKEMATQMGITVPIHFQIRNDFKNYGFVQPYSGGYVLSISPYMHNDAAHVYSTVMHEFGHIVCFEKFENASQEVKYAVQAAYENWRTTASPNDTVFQNYMKRSNFIHTMNARNITKGTMVRQTADGEGYWMGFDEWFAEQVARWATTKLRPVTIVDRFFSALGKQIREMFQTMSEKLKLNFQPVAVMADWLDSFVEGTAPMGEGIMTANDFEGRRMNAEEMERAGGGYEELRVPPRSSETSPVRAAIRRLFGGRPPATVNGLLAGVDHYNNFYKYMLSLPQVAARNGHIRRLQLYKEDVALMQLEKSEIMNGALETMKAWQGLGEAQGDNVTALMDGLSNMEYLSPEEVKQKRIRWPTQIELDQMQAKYEVSPEGMRVAGRIISDFRKMLLRYEAVLVLDANKIRDPIAQAQRLEEISKSVQQMLKGPYFPAMRFGDLTLTIRDGLGNVKHFETHESEKDRQKAKKELEKDLLPGDAVFEGVLPDIARPLMGVPPHLLDKISDKLALSDKQREALDELKFELAPSQSYKHRFQRKKRVKGYSLDYKRAYANYFFHGSNHLTRIKYVDQLRDHVKAVRDQAGFMPSGTKRGKIANFMMDHLQELLDPKPDFAALRSLAFMWHLSFDAPAALINLMQLPVITQPYLASKFGDLKSAAAMARASTKLSTFYKQATLTSDTTDEEIMALGEAVREGIITEALAPELAALSEGRNLRSHSGKALQQAWVSFKELGATMFQLAEQTNRRITFRAAWKLAKENPATPYIEEVIKTNVRQYESLRQKGWTHDNAAAFVVAKQMVENTQFVYGSHAQPRLFRGKVKSVLVFKSFVQNTLFALWNNPSAAMRSLLTMGALGGLMGLPGAEDGEDIVNGVAYQVFGKDFSLSKEVRKFVLDMSGDPEWGDLALHGLAREGFGIPAVMDMLGVHAIPEFDQSRNIGMGRILPIDTGELTGPSEDSFYEKLGRATQTASGAGFSIPLNIWKAASDWQLGLTDAKRLEVAMPGYLKALSRAYRYATEGMERSRDGTPIVKFDTTDPKQMAEIIGVGLGYTPTRISREWDRINAEREAITYWDIRRGMLLSQMDVAVRTKDKEMREEIVGDIKKFNKDLPKEARGKAITRDTIQKSLARRAEIRGLKEKGIPIRKADRPLARSVQELYPMGDIVEERKVR